MQQHFESYHIYPKGNITVFLQRAVSPFLEKNVWNDPKGRAFYVQYEDEKGKHIRLRLRGEGWDEKVTQTFEERGTIEKTAYRDEMDRYGGETGLFLCENQFNLSTKTALARLSRPNYLYGDALFDAVRFGVSIAAAANLSRPRIKWYFEELFKLWMPVYFRNENGGALTEEAKLDIEAAFDYSFRQQEYRLKESLDGHWMSLIDQDFPQDEPEWAFWYKGNKLILDELGDLTERVLPSLIHLHHNRLGINNQDEVFVCYLIANGL